MKNKPWVLFNPGPVNVSDKVRNALARPDICHREKEYTDLLASTQSLVLEVCGLDKNEFGAVFVTGSGTAALELSVCSSVSGSGKVLVVENGIYGERIRKILEIHNIPSVCLVSPWVEPPDLNKLEDMLKNDPAIESIALVHHETTTGLINPVNEVGNIAGKYGKLFLVDTISGLGGEAINIKNSQISLAVCTANKCFQGLPGVSFSIFRKDIIPRLSQFPVRSLYLNFKTYLDSNGNSHVPFTPSIPITYAFEAALEELREEGINRRIERFQKYSSLLRGFFDELNLEYLLPTGLRSNTITSIKLPPGLSYSALHDKLKNEGFVIYAGQGMLAEQIFRVANMGYFEETDLNRFGLELKKILRENSN